MKPGGVPKPVVKKIEEKPGRKERTPLEERHYTLSLFDQEDLVARKVRDEDDTTKENEEEEESNNYKDDKEEFEVGSEVSSDQVINEEDRRLLLQTDRLR